MHPRRWPELLNQISLDLCGRRARAWTAHDALVDRGLLIVTGPSPDLLLASTIGIRIGYLCWGLPLDGPASRRGLVSEAMLRAIRGASRLWVNESLSYCELKQLTRRSARRLPYLVDDEFFRPSGTAGEYLLAVGSNDRDAATLRALADAGQRVVWICPDAQRSGGQLPHHPFLEIVSGASDVQVRTWYSGSRAVVLPLTADRHAAGQTVALEGLASGKPVVMSDGRAARIFRRVPTTLSVPLGAPVDAWLGALDRVQSVATPESVARVSRELSQCHGFEALRWLLGADIRRIAGFLPQSEHARRTPWSC